MEENWNTGKMFEEAKCKTKQEVRKQNEKKKKFVPFAFCIALTMKLWLDHNV